MDQAATSSPATGVKLELFRRFGALPGAGDRHVAEFFPGFLTEESDWGGRLGRATSRRSATGSAGRRSHLAEFEAMLAARRRRRDAVGRARRRGDRVHSRRHARLVPAQSPEHRPGRRSPACRRGREHVRRRRRRRARARRRHPPARTGRRSCGAVSVAQELTVEAALTGDRGRRDRRDAASTRSPVASTTTRSNRMTDELLAATRAWLPQFA